MEFFFQNNRKILMEKSGNVVFLQNKNKMMRDVVDKIKISQLLFVKLIFIKELKLVIYLDMID